MKNKKVKLGILMLAALMLFSATAFASAPADEGYKALKQIMMERDNAELYYNATVDCSFQMTDNGKVLATVSGKVKGDHEAGQASGNVNIKLTGTEQALSFYKSKDATFLTDETNGQYYQLVNMSEDSNCRYDSRKIKESHKMDKTGEAFLDILVGDLKTQFSLLQNADGTKSITLDLNQDEIPASWNLLISAAAENKRNCASEDANTRMDASQKELLFAKFPFLKEFEGKEKEMPKLETNVKVKHIMAKLTVDQSNQVKAFEASINITGEDAGGALHDVIISGSAAISGLNSTTVDTFNPDGKTIETVDMQAFKKN